MNTTETFEAICINKGDTKYLTNDKPYLVSQSKEYENYYDLINDIGNIDSYRKERFKVVVQQFGEDEENNIQILSNGNIILSIKDSEVEKVEDKVIKVRCIENYGFENSLVKGTIYTLKHQKNGRYILEEFGEDYEFSEDRFIKVEQMLMVECTCNLKMNPAYYSYLTLGKKYVVIEETKEEYLIENDKGEKETWYSKKLFKPVESQNINKAIDNLNKSIGSFMDKTIKSAEKEIGKQLKEKIMEALEVNKEEEQPINYEEEYEKLKEESEMMDFVTIEEYNLLKERNERLKKEVEEGYECIENEYKNKLFLAEQKADESINSLMLLNDKYMEKQKKMESDLIKYEDTIKTLKGIIKNISEVL